MHCSQFETADDLCFYASVRYVLRELCKWFESLPEKAAALKAVWT